MYQKDAAKAAWTAAGLYRSKDAKLRKFLKYFDDSPMDCWPEVVKKARSDYSEYMEQLVQPLWQIGDKLLRVNLIRYADLSHKNEFELLAKLSHKLKADEDRPELSAIVHAGTKPLLKQVLGRKDLPAGIRALAERRSVKV